MQNNMEQNIEESTEQVTEQSIQKSNVDQLKWLLKNPLEGVLCLLLIAIVLVTFIQVVFRYVVQSSLSWSEELARYMFLWLATLTSAYAFKTGSHFALRFVTDKLGPKPLAFVNFLVVTIVSLFLIIFTWKAIEYTFSMAGQIAPSTGMSMAVPYSSAIVGGGLMLYYVVKNWIDSIRKPKSEEPNTEN